MVKPMMEMLLYSIKNTKMRIKHHERHGKGGPAMEDKAALKKQEKLLQDRLAK